MSAVIENTPIVVDVNVNAKDKKPTLPGKYSKLLNFGFWFASSCDSDETKAQLHALLRLFGSVDEQTELFERFLSEEKDVAKIIRKRIAEHNKPPKTIKEKKATRKSKAVVHQDELISQLIADANADAIPNLQIQKADKAAKEAEKEAAKAAKEAEKVAAKAAKEAEKAAALAAKEAEKAAALAAKEAAKEKAKKPTKEELKAAKEAEKEAAKAAKEAEKEAAKLAKEAEKEAAKLAKEAEKSTKVKPEKKAKTAKVVQEVAPVAEELVAQPIAPAIDEAPIVDAPPLQVADELVAEEIEPIASPAKEPKSKKGAAKKEPKAKSEKKTKKTELVKPTEDEEEIQTRIATIGDTDYLIDQEFNVYNLEAPHDHIGVYNQETGVIDALA
jgi:hypothetical protein